MTEPTVADRVRAIMGDRVEREFAKSVGIPYSTLKGVLDGSRPSVDKVVAIARACHVSLEWLATGEETKVDQPEPSNFVEVPRYDVTLSAGHGSFIDQARLLDVIPFPPEFFTRRLGRGPAGLVMVDARGDSMEPTIADRDLVMIDTSDTVAAPAIWALHLDDAVMIKRINPTPAGLRVVADNPAYEPFTVDRSNEDRFHLIGRVVWVGRVL